ncbi:MULTISPECIES: FHA domain-containing protein [Frankia]|uniref:FHA domain-containing protein n=1 Tax=Frankia TaxID=1854 RepID=UPI000A6E5D81|nr:MULTISPECIES: FHA domain-containing protein [Frankia]
MSTPGWVCVVCRSPVSRTAVVCGGCGTVLTDQSRIRDDPPPADSPGPPDASPGSGGPPAADAPPATRLEVATSAEPGPQAACPTCQRSPIRPGELVCPFCASDLRRAAGGGGGPGGVELRFDRGTVVIPAGETAVIGRHGTHDSGRVLHGRVYVSRRHVLIRVAADGTAQGREENPTANGTFVDGRRLGTTWSNLPDGAQLRLGSATAATVRYGSARRTAS